MKRFALAAICGLGLMTIGSTATAQTKAPASRPAPIIANDLNDAMTGFAAALDQGQVMQSADSRKTAATSVLPLAKKSLALIEELSAAQPASAAALGVAKVRFQAFTLIFGDTQERADLEKVAAGKGSDAIAAKAILATADYVASDGNSAAQIKAINDYEATLKADPGDVANCGLAGVFMSIEEPPTDVAARFIQVMKADIPFPEIQQAAAQMEAANNLRLLENKPLNLQGVTLDGAKFNSADWKGKVILVDFWALWSENSVDEMADVKKAYGEYHSKGLEILGISCDKNGAVLRRYMAANPDVAWPQLFEDKTAGMHPLAISLGVKDLPTVFLIDRKGILRSVEGVQKMEEIIPKLLAEKAP